MFERVLKARSFSFNVLYLRRTRIFWAKGSYGEEKVKARVCKTLITGSNPVDASQSCSKGQLFVLIASRLVAGKPALVQARREGVRALIVSTLMQTTSRVCL